MNDPNSCHLWSHSDGRNETLPDALDDPVLGYRIRLAVIDRYHQVCEE